MHTQILKSLPFFNAQNRPASLSANSETKAELQLAMGLLIIFVSFILSLYFLPQLKGTTIEQNTKIMLVSGLCFASTLGLCMILSGASWLLRRDEEQDEISPTTSTEQN